MQSNERHGFSSLGEYHNNGVQRNERDGSRSLGGYHRTTSVEDNDKESYCGFNGYHTTMRYRLKRKDDRRCHITVSR